MEECNSSFYLYTQKEYGDIKFYAQLNVDTEHDTISELIEKYSYGTKGREGISTIRGTRSIDSSIEGLRSSSNGRNRRNADAKGQGRTDGGNGNLDIRQQSNRARGNGVVRNDAQKRGDNQGYLEYETGKEQKKGKEDENREDGKGSEGEVRDYDNLSTVELLESLKTVDGDEYYRRVTEIARRGASGQHILDGSLKNVGVPFANADERGGFKNFVHAAATVIALDTARSRGEVFDLETGREAHKSAGVHVDADARNKQEGLVPYGISEETERETARRIAEWARRNGLFFDDETIEEHWPTQGLIGNGNNVEYDVLLTADGKSVIKKTNIEGIKTVDGENLPGSILYKLLELAYENIAFGENPRSLIAVLEGCYLDGGDVRFAFSQRYITGQTVEEKFGKDWQAMQEYIDGKMRELGYSMYIRKEEDELFGEVERHYYTKGGILVADVNAANVIIDDSGKAHVIDCWAMPIPANLEQEYESVNYHDGGVEESPLTLEALEASDLDEGMYARTREERAAKPPGTVAKAAPD